MLMSLFEVVGGIDLPDHIKPYGDISGADATAGGGGFLGLVSNIIKLIITIGGLWAFANLLIAGFVYVTQGDKPDELVKAHQRIYMSLIGLVVMIGSFALTMVISYLLYGNAGAIFDAKISGPNTPVITQN